MKYLLVLAVIIVAYLLWRAGRASARAEAAAAEPRPDGAPPLPQDMVRCPVCSLHLPRADALPGASGRLYCSPEHRRSGGN